MSENNFECFVSTGVNSRRTVFPNSALARLNPSAAFAPRNPSRRLIEVGVLKRWTVARIAAIEFDAVVRQNTERLGNQQLARYPQTGILL
jgi:hypothetical protein